MKIAVIGSGISGLSASYLLSKEHHVDLYEKDSRLGGHTATIDFELDGCAYRIDTGFIVYNEWTYPNFIKLLNQLGVETSATSMGFSVSCKDTGLEYAGNNLNTLFAQRKNLISPSFILMLRDILRFNQRAQQDLLAGSIDEAITLGEYLTSNSYSNEFIQHYLLPMGAAIWSMSCEKMYAFPLKFFVTFFKNHGLLSVKNKPTWRVIKDGSNSYIPPMIERFKDNIALSSDIASVSRNADGGATVHFGSGESIVYDHVVIATHSDQALKLLAEPTDNERSVLGAIRYESNSVVLHYDINLLPKNRRTWSSWNYKIGSKLNGKPTLTYNMNILQNLKDKRTFCVTLNDDSAIDPSKVIGRYTYDHPQFTLEGEQAKHAWESVNGRSCIWFCGAYWRNGFHEDGLVSAIRIAEKFGISL